jgi:hypothetical protein
MTVATDASTLSTIDEIILQAYRRAGLIPIDFGIGADSSWNAKAEHGRLTLNRLINQLPAETISEHFTNFFVLDLTSGTPSYAIDTDENILNFVDYGSHIPESNDPEEVETTGETQVQPITRHRWNSLSSKVAEGIPTLYYLHRNGGSLTLYLWPIPSEDSKIRFQVQRIPGSNSTGSDNPDLQRHWDSWMVNALAYEFMSDSKLPLEERLAVKADRDEAKELMKAQDSANEPPDVIFTHCSPWSGYNR